MLTAAVAVAGAHGRPSGCVGECLPLLVNDVSQEVDLSSRLVPHDSQICLGIILPLEALGTYVLISLKVGVCLLGQRNLLESLFTHVMKGLAAFPAHLCEDYQ